MHFRWSAREYSERRDMWVAFFILFGTLVSHALLETARDTLFLSKLPASQLPWVYLIIATLTFLVVELNSRLSESQTPKAVLSFTLLMGAIGTSMFSASINSQNTLILYAFYVWTGLLVTLLVGQLWILLGSRFTVHRAKRAYGFIGAGGLLGATVGSFSASLLTQHYSPQNLLIASPAVLVVTAFFPWLLTHKESEQSQLQGKTKIEVSGTLQLLKNHPYVRAMTLLALFSTFAITTMDLAFKSAIAETIPKEQLGAFFGIFYGVLNAIALILQVFLASWLVRRFGVHQTLWALPSLFLGAGVLFSVTGAFIPIALAKAFDGILRHSINNTAKELLFVPLSPIVRTKAKALVDGIAVRGGQAIAAVVVLVAFSLGATTHGVGVWIVAFALIWCACVAWIRPLYLQLFRNQLRDDAARTSLEIAELDVASLETLLEALNSDDESKVLNALELLDHWKKPQLIPGLILYHPDPKIVLRALEILSRSGRRDFLPIAKKVFYSSKIEQTKDAALRAYTAVCVDEELMREALNDESHCVKLTAKIALVARGFESPEALEEIKLESLDERQTISLARTVREHWDERLTPLIPKLATVNDRIVVQELSKLAIESTHPMFIDLLIPKLDNRLFRPDIRAALLSFGDRALDSLERAMQSNSLSFAVKRHIPRTISRFSVPKAVNILVSLLMQDTNGVVGYKVLRGLGRMVIDSPDLSPKPKILDRIIQLVINRIVLLSVLTSVVSKDMDKDKLLHLALIEKRDDMLERLFRLFGLKYPWEDFQKIHRGLMRGEESSASSLELIENILDKPFKDTCLILLTHDFERDGVPKQEEFQQFQSSRRDVLLSLLSDPSDTIKILAAQTLLNENDPDLRARLETAQSTVSTLVRKAFREIGQSAQQRGVA